MRCDQKRSELNLPDPAAVRLLYCGSSPTQVRGSVTGQFYKFAGPHPIQYVDWRDLAPMMQTRLFRQVPCR
jgi:hypothetical protein